MNKEGQELLGGFAFAEQTFVRRISPEQGDIMSVWNVGVYYYSTRHHNQGVQILQVFISFDMEVIINFD